MFLLQKQALANAILSLIQFKLGDALFTLTIEPYINGRECGWSIAKFGPQYTNEVVFSENRNSDQIVLYRGRMQDFGNGNVPSEPAYKKARYYDAEHVWKCVEDAIGHLDD